MAVTWLWVSSSRCETVTVSGLDSRNGLGTEVTEGFAEATSKKNLKGGWSPDDSFRALSGSI